MSILWNDWYHITCNTYGTWLRGDPRGAEVYLHPNAERWLIARKKSK